MNVHKIVGSRGKEAHMYTSLTTAVAVDRIYATLLSDPIELFKRKI